MSAAQPTGQAPTVDRPQRWPLLIVPSNRQDNTDKDARLVNGFLEKELQGDVWLYKRPGFVRYQNPSGSPEMGYGCYNWRGVVYSIFDGHLYGNTNHLGDTINTTNGVYRWSSIMTSVDGGLPKVIFGNGVHYFSYNVTEGLEDFTGNMPPAAIPTKKGIAYLNGSTYVITGEAAVFGSEINDVETWEADDVILAQIEPSRGVALSKQLTFIIAFKENSTEIFYDAGNSTGSLLGSVSGAKLNFGCISGDSVRQLDGALFWLCTNESATVQVMKMDSLKAEIISTPSIERLLENADFSSVFSWTLKLEGHRWYIITLKNNNLTLVYDLTTGVWAQWTDTNGNYLPFVDSTYITATAQTIIQHESDGWLYVVSNTVYVDEDGFIPMNIVTPNYDGGTIRDKTLNAMYFDTSADKGSILRICYSDNDYRTWSQWREVDLSQRKPMQINNGTFRRRAYWLQHLSPTFFRIKSIDLQMDVGNL